MTDSANTLLAQAMTLSPEDRTALAVQLLESLEETEPEAQVADEWAQEIERRIEEADRGNVPGVPWEEVKPRLGI
jgi:putative addiction module component (TIGR02574 family)